MLIGPRYKKARYLGIPVFRKTQSQKFAMRSQRKMKTGKGGRRGGKSEYGKQLLEKQKARYSYGISSGQFAKYARQSLDKAGDNTKNLLKALESRLDNVVLRAGFAPTRSAARQLSAHGHFKVNGMIVKVPSRAMRVGDKIAIREGSRNKAIFGKLDEEFKNIQLPSWINVNPETKEISVVGEPSVDLTELLFDPKAVLEFYTR